MNLNDMFTTFFPAISAIFRLGFIPAPDEIHEITEEQYAAYERSGGNVSKRLYTIIPKKYKILASMPSNEVNLLSEDEFSDLAMAVTFLHQYAKDNGCDSEDSDTILKFTAERLPPTLTQGTKFERPILKKLEPGETHLTNREEWSNLLAFVVGEGASLDIKVTSENTKETKNISLPFKKYR